MTLIQLFITAVSPLTARRAISHLYRQPQVPHCHFRQPSSFSLLRVITVSMSKQIHQLTFESHNINHHTMWHTLSSALFHFWWFADEQNHATFSYPQCGCCSLPLLIHTLSSPPCWIWCGHCRSYDQVGFVGPGMWGIGFIAYFIINVTALPGRRWFSGTGAGSPVDAESDRVLYRS